MRWQKKMTSTTLLALAQGALHSVVAMPKKNVGPTYKKKMSITLWGCSVCNVFFLRKRKNIILKEANVRYKCFPFYERAPM